MDPVHGCAGESKDTQGLVEASVLGKTHARATAAGMHGMVSRELGFTGSLKAQNPWVPSEGARLHGAHAVRGRAGAQEQAVAAQQVRRHLHRFLNIPNPRTMRGRAFTAPTQFMAALEPRNRPSQRSRCAAISTASRSVPWKAASTCGSGSPKLESCAAAHVGPP